MSRSEDNGGERRFSSEVRNEDTVLCTLNVMNPSEFAVCYIYIYIEFFPVKTSFDNYSLP